LFVVIANGFAIDNGVVAVANVVVFVANVVVFVVNVLLYVVFPNGVVVDDVLLQLLKMWFLLLMLLLQKFLKML
jgi:hypothetical protein